MTDKKLTERYKCMVNAFDYPDGNGTKVLKNIGQWIKISTWKVLVTPWKVSKIDMSWCCCCLCYLSKAFDSIHVEHLV